MQRYVDQLISDLGGAHYPCSEKNANEGEISEFSPQSLDVRDDDMRLTFSQYCGIRSIQFPPYQRLSKAQVKSILKAFREMVLSWSISLYLPTNLSLEKRYDLSRRLLDEKITLIEGMHTSFDFCEQDSRSCPYGTEFCSCLAYEMECAENKKAVNRQLKKMHKAISHHYTYVEYHGKFCLVKGNKEITAGILKPVFSWLNLNADFPWWGDLNENEMQSVIKKFKKIWVADDGLLHWLLQVDITPRYQQLICFLKAKAWFDGKSGFYIPSLNQSNLNNINRFDYLLKDENVYWKNINF